MNVRHILQLRLFPPSRMTLIHISNNRGDLDIRLAVLEYKTQYTHPSGN